LQKKRVVYQDENSYCDEHGFIIHFVRISCDFSMPMTAGETDFLKPYGMELIESCVEPVVIHHPKGHTIPRLGTDHLYVYVFYLFVFMLVLR